MFTSLEGKSVVVTGASKGIGKGIARVFARQKVKLLLVARSQETLDQAMTELGDLGSQVSGFCADVAKLDDMKAMAREASQRHGGIDVLCANAGIFPDASLQDMTEEQWDLVLNTNLKGGFFSIQACLPYLKQSEQGRVIMTSSITGPITGYPGWTHYAASKAGQLGFMRTAAIELARDGVTINAVLPGNIYTEGLADLGEDYLRKMAASIPLKKLGDVEDIGNTALFLASREAAYITGQSIVVDGGQTLPESLEAL